ncbi:unnamed protein product [Ilex paraguariensis]|uniref:glutathione transferase n=1 Tax=Ilex paraguariensis TaxID=185542 RepID=A0ABC8U2H5_9AQUA
MGIKVHGGVFSTATMRVFACLNEKEIHFEFTAVDMRTGEHKKEHFLLRNPFGKLPAFEDGDLKLFESRAITKYIASTHSHKGTQLVIEDPKKKAIMSVWMEVEAHQFDPPASKLTWELALKPQFGMVTDEAVVKVHEVELAKVLDIYEARLSESKYLGGDCFTLVDLHHLPTMHYLMGTKIKALFGSRPHVSAWCAECLARPAWLKVVAMQKKE